MPNKVPVLTDEVVEYFRTETLREADILRRLREETEPLRMSMMQIPPEQGQFFGLLVELLGVKRAIEIGTFTGYSALSVALALPEDGRLICCDVSEEWTSIGQRYWAEAGVEGKIDLRIAPASETLQALLDGGQAGTFDFAFIDADKEAYDNYYELVLRLIRPGGLIALDNMLMGGTVASPEKQYEGVVAIRALNAKIRADARVSEAFLPFADGIMLARKR